MKTITLHSSHGEAIFNAQTGIIIEDRLESADWPAELKPYRLDLEDFRRQNPGASPEGDFDILMFGYWCVNGQYAELVWKVEGEEVPA